MHPIRPIHNLLRRPVSLNMPKIIFRKPATVFGDDPLLTPRRITGDRLQLFSEAIAAFQSGAIVDVWQ
jgi:hypothetical protein